jgi:hypothetical protein
MLPKLQMKGWWIRESTDTVGQPQAVQPWHPDVAVNRRGPLGYSCRQASQIAGQDVAQSAFGMLPQSQPGTLRTY